MTVGIGSKLWKFSENRRKYTKPEKGDLCGKLIWREHWEPMYVVGETRVSWLMAWERHTGTGEPKGMSTPVTRIPKALFKDGGCPQDWALSEAHLDELVWAHENRHRLSEAVARCHSPAMLRAVERTLLTTQKEKP